MGQQAITWANVDPVLCHHTASLDPNELIKYNENFVFVQILKKSLKQFLCMQYSNWAHAEICHDWKKIASCNISVKSKNTRQVNLIFHQTKCPGPPSENKDCLSRYGDFHYKDKMVVRPILVRWHLYTCIEMACTLLKSKCFCLNQLYCFVD